MSAGELRFVPLGGVGEIGMNVYLYGLDDSWLMVDLGLTFADDRLPGADIVLPDIRFAEQERDRSRLVLTHAHEDHLGAVPYLWPRLRCPIWCSAFTAAVLRRKFAEEGIAARRDPRSQAERARSPPAASLPPPACDALDPRGRSARARDRLGTVLHSGDWKLDPAPLVGDRTDDLAFERLGESRVLALVCDSTNVLTPGTSGSEAEVRDSLVELIRGAAGARRPHHLRLEHRAARDGHHRGACRGPRGLRGRPLDAAHARGCARGRLSQGLPPVLDERDAAALPRQRRSISAPAARARRARR